VAITHTYSFWFVNIIEQIEGSLMKGSVLANQVILNKGERVAYIYKLTRGSVHILDSKNHVVF